MVGVKRSFFLDWVDWVKKLCFNFIECCDIHAYLGRKLAFCKKITFCNPVDGCGAVADSIAVSLF